MKKLLGILVLGLLWCNAGVAETLESIEKKYESSLPECEGGTVSFGDFKKWNKWNNCVGKLKFELEPTIFYESEFIDGEMLGILKITVENYYATWFTTITKKGCKRNGHAIKTASRKLFKVKYSKDCEPIKETPIK